MKEVEIKMVLDATEAIKEAKKVEDKVEDVGVAAKKSKKGFGSMAKGVKAVGTALKAAGIGLVIAMVAGLTEAFSRNKKVMDTVSVVMGTIQEVFSQVSLALIDTYEAIAKSSENFDALGKVISGLMTLGFAPLKIAFYGIIAAAEGVKLAYEQMFGDEESIAKAQANLDETNEQLKQIAIETNQAGRDIVENFGEAIGEFTNIANVASENFSKVNIKVATETAKAYLSATDASILAQSQAGRLVAQYERQSEVQRQLRDDTSKSIDERIAANKELGAILDKQEKAMLKQADAVIAGARAELQKNNSIENQAALIDALAGKEQIVSDITGKRSEQLVNEVGLLKEKNALEVAITDGQIERNRKQREFDAEQEVNPLAKLEKQREAFELENQLILEDLEAKRLLYAEGTAERIAAEEDYKNKSQDITNSIAKNKIESVNASIQADKDLATSGAVLFNAIAGLASENQKLQKAMIIAKQAAAAVELLIDLGAIKSKATRTLAEANLDASKSASSVATGLSATLALGFPAAVPALVGYAAAAAGIVSGVIGAVKSSKSTAAQYGATGGGSSPVAAPSAPAPSFNLVEGSADNQIQNSIQNAGDKPIKAFVVAQDVTSQQSLDRQIEQNAGV